MLIETAALRQCGWLEDAALCLQNLEVYFAPLCSAFNLYLCKNCMQLPWYILGIPSHYESFFATCFKIPAFKMIWIAAVLLRP